MGKMVDGTALSITFGPVGAMLLAAIASAAWAIHAWRSVSHSAERDALAGLFHGDTLSEQLSDPKLRRIRARGQRRTANLHSNHEGLAREAALNRLAAVIRGNEQDARVVREATRYLAGEGFIVVENVAEPITATRMADVIEIEELEEIKLLPPPSPAKAA